MENPGWLKNKYNDLHSSKEVKAAVRSEEAQTGEKLSQNPEKQIQSYLDRLEKLVLDPDKKQSRKMMGKEQRPRAVSLLREMVMNEYIRPNKEKLAEGAARVEERAARNLGMDIEYGEEQLEQRGEIAIEDLEKSLDNWISYLSDANEPYPTWFRYYAFRNILKLGDYDKDKKEFTKRTKGSTKLFPEIDRGALAYIQQNIEASKDPKILAKLQEAQKQAANGDVPEDQLITKEKVQNFSNLSFAKQYAEGISKNGEITPELRAITEGKWVKYQQGTEPTALWSSLQNKGTAWCTKGFATAKTQLEGGDFYVYYTLDKKGSPTIPRIAIRMQGENVGEARGVEDSDQNMEGNMIAIAEEKLSTLPGAESYKEKTADMKMLTSIYNRHKQGEELIKEDLIFLYEIDKPIQGFGYKKDPRIEEIRDKRDVTKDASIVFECTPDQIAKNINEVNENTVAYIGQWNIPAFQVIKNHPNIIYFYESFPDKKIFMQTLETDPSIDSPDTAKQSLKDKNIYLSDWGKDILEKTEFSKEKQEYDLVRFTVEQLGFPNGATTDEIYNKAQELGLELCPAEIGPQLRLQSTSKEWMLIAMKQIIDRDGAPKLFDLNDYGVQLALVSNDAGSDDRWDSDGRFVFHYRPSSKA
ncbi:MAG: hypothetical protein ACKKL5_00390 [Candidatus Komeilibacteria bacterium]